MASWSERLNQVTQSAISRSKEVAGIARLSMENSTLNQNLKSIYTEVGAYVLEKGLLAEEPSVADWAAKAADIKADIEANTEKINRLKNVTICPDCGAEVPRENKFCAKCGAAVVVKTSESEEAPEDVIDASYTVNNEKAEPEGTEAGGGEAPETAEKTEE